MSRYNFRVKTLNSFNVKRELLTGIFMPYIHDKSKANNVTGIRNCKENIIFITTVWAIIALGFVKSKL